MKRGGGKAGISTNVLHLPRFAPAVRLEPWQRLSVRAAATLANLSPQPQAGLTCSRHPALLSTADCTATVHCLQQHQLRSDDDRKRMETTHWINTAEHPWRALRRWRTAVRTAAGSWRRRAKSTSAQCWRSSAPSDASWRRCESVGKIPRVPSMIRCIEDPVLHAASAVCARSWRWSLSAPFRPCQSSVSVMV